MKKVTVKVAGDTTVEDAETLRLSVSALAGPARLRRPFAIGTIVDDDGGSGIHAAVGDATVVEGDTGKTRSLQFPVTLSAPATSAVNLSYVVTPGSATRSSTAGGRRRPRRRGVGHRQVPGDRFGHDRDAEGDHVAGVGGRERRARRHAERHDLGAVTPPGCDDRTRRRRGLIVDDDGPGTDVPAPGSMAALGDSISRGLQLVRDLRRVPVGGLVDRERRRRRQPLLPDPRGEPGDRRPRVQQRGQRHDHVEPQGQAQSAVGQHVEYVTIEMGGNDVCKPTEAQMTSVATYQSAVPERDDDAHDRVAGRAHPGGQRARRGAPLGGRQGRRRGAHDRGRTSGSARR